MYEGSLNKWYRLIATINLAKLSGFLPTLETELSEQLAVVVANCPRLAVFHLPGAGIPRKVNAGCSALVSHGLFLHEGFTNRPDADLNGAGSGQLATTTAATARVLEFPTSSRHLIELTAIQAEQHTPQDANGP